ncbi:hypothetical protein SCALM49S_01963 [Streptomyces californicus]
MRSVSRGCRAVSPTGSTPRAEARSRRGGCPRVQQPEAALTRSAFPNRAAEAAAVKIARTAPPTTFCGPVELETRRKWSATGCRRPRTSDRFTPHLQVEHRPEPAVVGGAVRTTRPPAWSARQDRGVRGREPRPMRQGHDQRLPAWSARCTDTRRPPSATAVRTSSSVSPAAATSVSRYPHSCNRPRTCAHAFFADHGRPPATSSPTADSAPASGPSAYPPDSSPGAAGRSGAWEAASSAGSPECAQRQPSAASQLRCEPSS